MAKKVDTKLLIKQCYHDFKNNPNTKALNQRAAEIERRNSLKKKSPTSQGQDISF